MSALTALFSVTVVLTALTCLDGTTVSAEMATMTMGCFHQVENLVKVSTREKNWSLRTLFKLEGYTVRCK